MWRFGVNFIKFVIVMLVGYKYVVRKVLFIKILNVVICLGVFFVLVIFMVSLKGFLISFVLNLLFFR